MIAVVGGGLAGLACARELQQKGRDVAVFEAAEVVGGRVATTHRDGFTLDHGFQVVLSSYASIPRLVNVDALRPRRFGSGALVWSNGRLNRIANPLTGLGGAWDSLTSSAFPLRDKCLVGLEMVRAMVAGDGELLAACASDEDTSVAEWLERRGFSNAFVERFARPFFGGVLLDPDLETSAALFRYYFKKFALGTAWVPAGGMSELPRAIAEGLSPGTVRLRTPVTAVQTHAGRATGLELADGSSFSADKIVVATGVTAACRLFGAVPQSCRPVAVVYFKTRCSLLPDPLLVLPEGRTGVVRHFVQITNAAPEYAPQGWHLVSATVLPPKIENDSLPASVAAEITRIFPHGAGQLEHIATIRVPDAVPVQRPGFAANVLPPPAPEGVLFAGDWANGASLEGAIASGIRAAAEC